MRIVIIFISILLSTWPNNVKACDDLGGPQLVLTTLASTIIIPLAYLGSVESENPPYRKAIRNTFVASYVGGRLALTRCEDSNENGEIVIGSSIVSGIVATYLTFRYATRPIDKTSSSIWQYSPQVLVLPVTRGGSIRLNWTF